jgi:hypothetical protein
LKQAQHIEKKPVILIGVLDWGLGHACRMIPVIHYLLQTQCQILIAATGQQRKVLELEFPNLEFLSPPEYDVKYNEKSRNLVFGLIRQLPRLFQVITTEKEWTRQIHRLYGLDLIISDNRYGMRLKEVISIVITHQIAPISGLGAFFDNILMEMHIRYLSFFNECWVPDMKEGGLAGKLSHSALKFKKLKFIGLLSRFENFVSPTPSNPGLLVLLSGPEPRRTYFEELLLPQLTSYKGTYTLVRGLPGHFKTIPNSVNHLEAKELQELIQNAEFIICRAGYTTIMDLAKIGKTAVLVPTTGQTEQEYLGAHLQKAGYFLHSNEEGFNLQHEVDRLCNFSPSKPVVDFQKFKLAVDELLSQLNSKV